MDFYPTRYSELSNSEINELYRSDMWSNLSYEERLDALQELENRTAEELGNQPCEVRTEEMNGAMYGYYCNGQIVVNESLVNNGVLRYEDGENDVLEYVPNDVNAQLMDTIHHENYHAYQDDVINNRIEHDNQNEVALWRSNEELYISSSDNSILYRIQSRERTAFYRGELQTKETFEGIEAKYGEDAGYQEYLISINEYSYEIALVTAKETYGDENIQETLDNYMLASYQENYVEDSISEVVINESDAVGDTDVTDTMDSTISSTDDVAASDSDGEVM
jgi:hypothetical protein